MTNRDDSEQLAWDFDAPESDGSSAAVVADEGLASLTPGSERWIAALQTIYNTQWKRKKIY